MGVSRHVLTVSLLAALAMGSTGVNAANSAEPTASPGAAGVAAAGSALAANPAAEKADGGLSITLGLPYISPPHQPGAKVRTPEGPAQLLAARLGKERPINVVAVQTPAQAEGATGATTAEPSVDVLLVPRTAGNDGSGEERVIPIGYNAGYMAIMRTDTDIKRWDDLRGRTVCLSEESGLVGQLQARYGAIEKIYRAPADALLDLRIGGCDATVHDSTMLNALLEFPEWQKFSAQLPVQEIREWAFVLPKANPALEAALESRVQQWRESGVLQKITQQSARDIAFEVYMDQSVPDCH